MSELAVKWAIVIVLWGAFIQRYIRKRLVDR